ncbi:MAG TPA: hypothetical protein VJ746_20595 [Nitrospira sp.]|nr:hypothetical protein [Nitrospira sp.]
MNRHSSLSVRIFMTSWSHVIAMVLMLTFFTLTVAPDAWSQEAASANSSEGGSASSAGMQAAAAVSSILYFPFKAVFAIGGGIVGGLAYAFSGGNTEAAKSIWTTSMYGTYIITPEHLRGDKPIRFLGVADNADMPAQTPPPATEPAR